ncbi:FRG domain-containing protein [Lacihabitans soyangensis]|uniref:FRG domain-containing protein n=1 Tax=Lacihabitans soyangensis TaxID=869394 RepID=A0AAE3KSK6_9BACT|nr:FRG domain-containing protein [Lacihabitans soyangensis]MCP9762684.1 FRG domain-containing protein [Lacihabitans soyangensis]
MPKRKISNLDLKVKLFKEYLDNGGVEKILFRDLLDDLIKVKKGSDGKVDPNTVSSVVNSAMLNILESHLSPPFFHREHISEYKSTLQKNNSFVQENIDSEKQFNMIYKKYVAEKDTLFRGQREAKWRLYSKLQRLWILEKLYEKYDFKNFLKKLIELGKEKYSINIQELLNENHIDSTNSISVLAYLQHHECPTPLLDWTYSFQNALYFAIDGLETNKGTIEIDDYFSVYYVEEKYFEAGSFRKIIFDDLDKQDALEMAEMIEIISNGDENKKKEMTEHFAGRRVFDRNKLNGSGFISHMTNIDYLINFPIGYFSDRDKDTGILFSLNNSKNILNQKGVFTWSADPSKPIELVGDEQFKEGKTEEDAKGYSFCSCFNIHKSLESHIRKQLDADGITKDFIYPSPDINTWEVFEKCKKME